MKNQTRPAMTAIATATLMVVTLGGCGTSDDRDGINAEPAAVQSFVTASVEGSKLDYDPLATPTEAVATADLVVVGRLVGVSPGVLIQNSSRPEAADRKSHHVAYEVEVDRVVSSIGDVPRPNAGDTVEVQVYSPDLVDVDALDAASPAAKILVGLDYFTPDTAMVNASGERIETAFFPFPDLLWLEDTAGRAHSPFLADTSQLEPAWGEDESLDSIVVSLETAAAGD